jgi:hypothetical protein
VSANNVKGATLPPRQSRRLEEKPAVTPQTDPELQEKQKQFVNEAALHTTPVQAEEDDSVESKYPWRRHHADTPVDVLWGTKKKKTVEIPMELALRIADLKSRKKPKRYGEKIDETSLIVEYLEEGTKRDYKALGFNVK